MDFNELIKNVNECYIPFTDITSKLEEQINERFGKSGLIYRVFSRPKSRDSVLKKMKKKGEGYLQDNRKMQDSIGVRIVLYFSEDIDISIKILKELFHVVGIEYDKPDIDMFKPQRINIVLSIPEEAGVIEEGIREKCLIDNTFEVQIRTIFSEGWHEVEHDFRYKYLADWKDEKEMSRDLNGLSAVLEICDRNIVGILDNVAYNKYKKKSWESMIRNRFRLRFEKNSLSDEIINILNNDADVSKKIFRFPKSTLVKLFYKTNKKVSFDNVVYLINYFTIRNNDLNCIMPDEFTRDLINIDFDSMTDDSGNKNPYNSIVSMKYL